jgi:outer membrane immunogenic protein
MTCKIAAVLCASALMFAMPAGAIAAEMPVKAPQPPPVATPDWTGFYFGINGGYGWEEATGSSACTAGGVLCDPGVSSIDKPEGGLLGAQIGYNWQSGIVVYGLETDIQWSDIKSTASATDVGPLGSGTFTATTELDWFGTFRGRLGITPWNNGLLYVTGGLIYGEQKTSASLAFPAVTFAGSASSTHAGGTFGVGLEYRFTPALSGKIEGLWYDMGSVTEAEADPLGPAGLSEEARFHLEGSIVRAGLNYHFNVGGEGPIQEAY